MGDCNGGHSSSSHLQQKAMFCMKDPPKVKHVNARLKKSDEGGPSVEDTEELKKKLHDCIKKFDEGSPETLRKLEILRGFLANKMLDETCFPKSEWPNCPPLEGPEAYEVPHPYLPGMVLYAKPQFKLATVQVTLDGRLAEQNVPRDFYHEEGPHNVPPWVLPRYKSQELRGGVLFKGCECWKKNGMQDSCPRWDCAGRPECKERPLPDCPPGMNPPICGLRKPNYYHGKPPSFRNVKPPPPYPVGEVYPIDKKRIPDQSSIACPLHSNISLSAHHLSTH